jgi:hypothetical protein
LTYRGSSMLVIGGGLRRLDIARQLTEVQSPANPYDQADSVQSAATDQMAAED